MPAPMAASEAVTAMLTTMVTHRIGTRAKSTRSPAANRGDHRQKADDQPRILDDQLAAHMGTDGQADELRRFGRSRHPTPLDDVESELLLVKQRGQ